MCLFGTQQTQQPAPVAPEPTRATTAASATTDPNSAVSRTRATTKRRLGVFGNITTTPMGDASYGRNIAAFGARAA